MNDDLITTQLEKLHQSKAATVMPVVEHVPPAYQPEKPTIVYDDFGKMDLRIGTIMAAQKIKKADKLLQLTVDLGYEQRTVVSGIALHYTPEEIIGQQVVLLANLAPRTMRGIESNGMILMAENAAGKLVFVSPQTVGFENGSTVQ